LAFALLIIALIRINHPSYSKHFPHSFAFLRLDAGKIPQALGERPQLTSALC